jgi:MerR family transcriptional regulator, thiopeptide resistance regulator
MNGKQAYTIKQLADIASVTTRTLRYYDQIGLLEPASTGENGYRYYDKGSLLRLQQILFLRELDVPLQEIGGLLSQPDLDLKVVLAKHRAALDGRRKRLQKLIETIDHTITNLKGENKMTDKEYFEGFDQSQYEQEVKDRWGDTPHYAESQHKWKSFSREQKDVILKKSSELTLRMVAQADSSPSDEDVQAAVGEYFTHMNQSFYTFNLEFFRNLSDMWVADERFAANYEKIRQGGAEFARQAVHIYCDNH